MFTIETLAAHLGIKPSSVRTMLTDGRLIRPDLDDGWSDDAITEWQAARPGRGRPAVSPLERFMAKVRVDEATGCWLWQGHVAKDTGYGTFRTDATTRGPAHRRGYELLVGPVPANMSIDHLCRVRHCVNPKHLEPVPQRVNNHRAPASIATRNSAKTHCPQGHAYTPENTRRDSKGKRSCRECGRQSWRAWYQAKKGAL